MEEQHAQLLSASLGLFLFSTLLMYEVSPKEALDNSGVAWNKPTLAIRLDNIHFLGTVTNECRHSVSLSFELSVKWWWQ